MMTKMKTLFSRERRLKLLDDDKAVKGEITLWEK